MNIAPSGDLFTRIEVLETRFSTFEHRQDDILKGLQQLSDRVASRQAPIAWREIGATIVAVLTIFAYAATLLENQFQKNTAVLQYRIEQLEQHTKPQPMIRLLPPQQ